ncbi:hypothetical protein RCL1_000832 [Eukaryota sp. TZLM3-RCL]
MKPRGELFSVLQEYDYTDLDSTSSVNPRLLLVSWFFFFAPFLVIGILRFGSECHQPLAKLSLCLGILSLGAVIYSFLIRSSNHNRSSRYRFLFENIGNIITFFVVVCLLFGNIWVVRMFFNREYCDTALFVTCSIGFILLDIALVSITCWICKRSNPPNYESVTTLLDL